MPQSKLPSLKPQQVIKVLKKIGFENHRQKGSHVVLINHSTGERVVIPMHKGKDVKTSARENHQKVGGAKHRRVYRTPLKT